MPRHAQPPAPKVDHDYSPRLTGWLIAALLGLCLLLAFGINYLTLGSFW